MDGQYFRSDVCQVWNPVQGLLDFPNRSAAATNRAMCRHGRAGGLFRILILRVTAPQMTPLFTDLT